MLWDVDAAVLNGNDALEAGLSPAEDTVAAATAEDSPDVNLLVTRRATRRRAGCRLAELQGQRVADSIAERDESALVPAA